jgi:hypothetical protein
MPQLWRYFVTTVGQHKQDRQVCTVACQVEQKFETGLVTPMEIFENEQQRLACGLLGEKMEQQGKQTALLLPWIKRGREDERRTLGDEWGDVGQKRGESLCKREQVVVSGKPGRVGKGRTQHIKEGSVRKHMICLKAVPLKQQKALSRGCGFHLRD